MLLEHISEEHRHAMTEDDGIGDLHHRRLDVQREQDVVFLGGIHLRREESAQRFNVHHRAVDDLAGLERHLLLQHRDRTVATGQLDPGSAGCRHGRCDLRAVEVMGRHIGDAGFRILAPDAHLVRMAARIGLYGAGGAAVGVALAQNRIDRAAQHLAVAGADFLVRRRRVAVGIVGDVVALALQLLDRGFELRDRGGNIGQLDDVGFRLHRQLAELGEFVVDLLLGLQLLGEVGQDAAGQRNVLQRHRHAGRADKGFDDRQQRISRERRGFIDLCPHDFEIWHACTFGRRAFLDRPETEH